MKNIFLIAVVMMFIGVTTSHAQFDDLLNKAKDKLKDKVEKKEDEALDKAIDGDQNSDKNADNSNQKKNAQTDNQAVGNNSSTASGQSPSIKVYRNYDFVPGDKVIFESQLADEQTGEIPSQFNLIEGQMDVQTEDGENVIHIPPGPTVKFSPRMTTTRYLPDQFTVEFDAKNEKFGTAHLTISFGDNDGDIHEVHFNDGGGLNWTTGDVDNPGGLVTDGDHAMTWHHFAIAINNNQGKVYIDQFRVANVNNITGKAESIIFVADGYENSFIKNIRIAAGGIGIYKMVTTNGKIVTHGILFDVDKATIKPQSMGTINEIYRVLQKNPSLKFEIDGHTDNTGNAPHNLTLSQQRADAVKAELVDLGIASSRLSTKGYGDTKPIGSNDTPEGRANNRRVEFIRMK